MATGHILPGYGQPVTNLRRAKSAYPLDKTRIREYAYMNVPGPNYDELSHIRDSARSVWSANPSYATSYNNHYTGRALDEPTRSRPTSPTRVHKPHPPLVFLTNRLHYIDGYHNPDTTVGKDVYRVDGIVDQHEQYRRAQLRAKFTSRPHTAAINQYADNGLKEIYPATEAQAATAWLKLADDKDKFQLSNVMEEEKTKQREQQLRQQRLQMGPPQMVARSHTMPSLHRWMKMAGQEEANRLSQVIQNTERPSSRMSAGCTRERRQQDVFGVGQSRYTQKPSRGDFLMHPDWPPNIKHHSVP